MENDKSVAESSQTRTGRVGYWMQMNSGRALFPADPKPADFTLDDIAHGLAKEQRYGNQSRIDIYYSVAEHSCLGADWIFANYNYGGPVERMAAAAVAVCFLLHDAPEGLGLRDLPRAVKHAAGQGYADIERKLETVAVRKYGVEDVYVRNHATIIKTVDNRIIVDEKPLVMTHPDVYWGDDFAKLLPLGVELKFWGPMRAKEEWLARWDEYNAEAGFTANVGIRF